MGLQLFSLFEDQTKILIYQDTLIKVKVSFLGKDLNQEIKCSFIAEAVEKEIEQAFRALYYREIREEPLISIKTKHFVISSSRQFWKASNKLKFCHGDTVYKVHPYFISMLVELNNDINKASSKLNHSNVSVERTVSQNKNNRKPSQAATDDLVDDELSVEPVPNTLLHSKQTSRPSDVSETSLKPSGISANKETRKRHASNPVSTRKSPRNKPVDVLGELLNSPRELRSHKSVIPAASYTDERKSSVSYMMHTRSARAKTASVEPRDKNSNNNKTVSKSRVHHSSLDIDDKSTERNSKGHSSRNIDHDDRSNHHVHRIQADSMKEGKDEKTGESNRLQKMRLCDIQPKRERMHAKRDRHVIEESELDENMKLQQLAKSLDVSPVRNLRPHKRKSSALWNIADFFLTPVKKIFRKGDNN